MRIATSQMFDRPASLMASLTQKADALQTQISTGKKFTAPSGDVGGYAQLQSLARADADGTAYAANVKLAQGALAQADSTLDSIGTQLQQAQELALQAANGTLTDANRQAIATSLDSIRDELLALANTEDLRGQPMFGGAGGGTPFVKGSDGAIAYTDSGEASPVPIGDGDSVVTSVSGGRFADMFASIKALSDALSSGGTVPADSLSRLSAAAESVSSARASVGARALRVDLVADQQDGAKIARADRRVDIEATDITETVTELQKTLTILQATQASFTKLTSMSLFDYLR
jgi:flagellar hook-associated protein 3 FlgL